jgi:hypothetical protein
MTSGTLPLQSTIVTSSNLVKSSTLSSVQMGSLQAQSYIQNDRSILDSITKLLQESGRSCMICFIKYCNGNRDSLNHPPYRCDEVSYNHCCKCLENHKTVNCRLKEYVLSFISICMYFRPNMYSNLYN